MLRISRLPLDLGQAIRNWRLPRPALRRRYSREELPDNLRRDLGLPAHRMVPLNPAICDPKGRARGACDEPPTHDITARTYVDGRPALAARMRDQASCRNSLN